MEPIFAGIALTDSLTIKLVKMPDFYQLQNSKLKT